MFAWQATVQDEAGNIVPLPVVTVWEADGTTLASIYDEAGVALPNPLTGTMEGFVQFWAAAGQYKVEGAKGGELTPEWDVALGNVYITKNASEFFALTRTPVGRYSSQDGMAWDIVASGTGDFDHPVTGLGVSVADLPMGTPYVAGQFDLHPTNTGSVNHAAAQIALDKLAGGGGGNLQLARGVYHISDDLTLDTGAGIVGHSNYVNYNGATGSVLQLASGKRIHATGQFCRVEGISILKSGAGPALEISGGWGEYRRLGINGGDGTQLLISGGANRIADILTVNGVMDRAGLSNYVGAVAVTGVDNFLSRIEANATSGFGSMTSGFAAALVLSGTNNWLTDCITELSEAGLVIAGGGRNRITAHRSDLNKGHGVVWISGNASILGMDCIGNGSAAADTYCGVIVTTATANGAVRSLSVDNSGATRLAYAVDAMLSTNPGVMDIDIIRASNVQTVARTADFIPARIRLAEKLKRVTVTGATISAENSTDLILTAASAVNIVSITGGYYGQEITIMSEDADVTLVHGAGGGNIILASGANYTFPASPRAKRLKLMPRGGSGGRWVEI